MAVWSVSKLGTEILETWDCFGQSRDRFTDCYWSMSHPDSWFDPICGSEPSSGCETIYWDSLPFFFFL